MADTKKSTKSSDEKSETIKVVEEVEVSPEVSPKTNKAPKERQDSTTFTTIIAVLALICAGTALVFSTIEHMNGSNSFISVADGNSTSFSAGSIAEVASKVSPSVVSVLTETRYQSWNGSTNSATAAGTGFIITKDGYIVTNKHVVSGADQVSIVLDDGTTYEKVEIVGTDPLNDVAILKVTTDKDLPAVTLGDSKTVSVGQDVIAIGNALGQYSNTVTSGIVSGLNRTIVAQDSAGSNYERLADMIQTDASINQGNSGGPLVNASGQVIAINTAVGSGNGLGFAIPIASVKGLIKNVLQTGKVERAYLGAYYIAITPEVAKQYNLSVTSGAYVKNSDGAAIISGSAAEKAGLKDGDIITAVDGVKIGTSGNLATLIAEHAPGETVRLTIIRDGEEKSIDVTLEAYQAKTNNTSKS